MSSTSRTLSGISSFRDATTGNGWAIARGDILLRMAELPGEAYDGIFTDVPYSSGGQFRGDRNLATSAKYQTSDSQAVYPRLLRRHPRSARVHVLGDALARPGLARRQARRALRHVDRLAHALRDDDRDPGRRLVSARRLCEFDAQAERGAFAAGQQALFGDFGAPPPPPPPPPPPRKGGRRRRGDDGAPA
jgi:hypothetical protein